MKNKTPDNNGENPTRNHEAIQIDVITLTDTVLTDSVGFLRQALPLKAEVQLTSVIDPAVQVVLVDKALAVIFKDCDPVRALFPDNTKLLVQQTIAFGYINHAANDGIELHFWYWQYPDDNYLPPFRFEIMQWWQSLPLARRRALSLRFVDNPNLPW